MYSLNYMKKHIYFYLHPPLVKVVPRNNLQY